MKRILVLVLIAAGALFIIPTRTSAAPTPATLGFSAHFGFFYNSLRPHGEWLELDGGVYVWRPFRVRVGWRPYMLGRWAWTDYGWYWVSREPFGWVTYHYGRWFFDDYYGWVWVPDDVWGPSWVEFRHDNDYVGWAPLPPYAGFGVSFGLRFTREWIAPVRYWNVIRVGYFGNEIRFRDVQSDTYARRLIGSTRTERNYEYRDQRVVNRGIDPSFFERRGNHGISRVDVVDRQGQTGEQFVRGGSRRTDRIEVYRPQPTELQSAPGQIEARRGERRTTMDLGGISRQTNPGVSGPDRAPSGQSPQGPSQQGQRIQRQPERIPSTTAPGGSGELLPPGQRQTPSVEKRVEPRQPQERRRQLIERNERQAPAPPVQREQPRVRKNERTAGRPAAHLGRAGSHRTEERKRK